MKMTLALMTSFSILFMMMKHPLSMGVILICQTLTVAVIMGMMSGSFLFSYIVMIIMLSGALVLFVYMASVASNEKFQASVKITIMYIMSTMIAYFTSYDYNEHFQYKIMKSEMMTLIKLYNTMSTHMTMMMIMYLLFTMIVVSNIATINEGPLRVKM